MNKGRRSARARMLCGVAISAVISMSGVAYAQDAEPIHIPSQSLATALNSFGVQTGRAVMFKPELAAGKQSRAVDAAADPELALNELLSGTGLSWRRQGDLFMIVETTAPQSGSAAGDGADGTVEALIVTAQKREEDIQDVPIAISAFTQEDLTRSQVAGGPDLMTQVPNMTFTKTNFSSYSIQLRGIGTQAISATTDAAVAVAFNNTPFIRNRFFEQEFYDLQRVEVLRGPQGTLYGRNATAGVVNILSAKPAFSYEAKLSGDLANYKSTRVEGMVNVPLVEDKVAIRLAGAWTKREGFVTNENTGEQIDGRDLWSTRASLRFTPTETVEANLIWEHFEEDDDRLRSGKQLCKTHEVTEVAGFPVTHFQTLPGAGQPLLFAGVQATFSQGCAPASFYASESYQTPSGLALPYYGPLTFVGLPAALSDPYEGRSQSTDLRVIQSTVDPEYRAKSDLVEAQLSMDVAAGLTLTSETAYSVDTVFSLQDFNRFNTAPGAWADDPLLLDLNVLTPGPNGAVFCDPQVGCADRLVAVDLSTAESTQFSQELRLSSSFDGPLNFSLGANFLRYDTEDKYYVFINSISLYAAFAGAVSGPLYVPGVSDNHACMRSGLRPGVPGDVYVISGCLYIEPNPIHALKDQGHNYFLSKNPYKLMSYAVFGELYYNITDDIKITGGARWTVDKKQAPRIPSWLFATESVGYPVAEVIEQEWRKPTGRLTLDWKPDFGFTDETLLYASYSHGYKAGGANPPGYTFTYFSGKDVAVAGSENSATRPKTFEPEYVNAFELGAKNTFDAGRMTLNLAAFYYDYAGYQISEIVDRSAFNRNYDAKVWGLEVEADWRPLENLRLGFKGGYENTRLVDGTRAIDLMDRTAGDPNWVVVSPFPSYASNCILPAFLFVGVDPIGNGTPEVVNVGGIGGGGSGGCELAYVLGHDPITAAPYVDLTDFEGTVPTGNMSSLEYHPNYAGWDPSTAPNNGEGIFKDIGGNELPNAPNFTATVTADYTLPLPSDWLLTLHSDLYYQSEAWTRVFNTEGYDKLKAYTNVNLAAIFSNESAGWRVMAYIKNVFDRDSITGAFLNSDDTGLTTNVFLTEPRLYGIRMTKEWTGGPWWTGSHSEAHEGEPYPLTVTIAGQAQRHDAPYTPLRPSFADAFSPTLDIFADPQNRDLDWGDGREVELSYRPNGSRLVLSASARYGRTNNGTSRTHKTENASEDPVCGVPAPFGAPFCDPTINPYYYNPDLLKYGTNLANSSATSREEHFVADFSVGRDVGIGKGIGIESTLGLGYRFARLWSFTDVTMDGTPNWYLPEGWQIAGKYSTHDRFASVQEARREFGGAGPTLSWDAALTMFDGGGAGHIELDWAVTGGILFGKQKASIEGTEQSSHFSGAYYAALENRTLTDFQEAPINIPQRSQTTSVPLLDLSLGLSYKIQRVKLGAGYRWERYFGVIDGGATHEETFDRTIDGPYFKIAIGFGG